MTELLGTSMSVGHIFVLSHSMATCDCPIPWYFHETSYTVRGVTALRGAFKEVEEMIYMISFEKIEKNL